MTAIRIALCQIECHPAIYSSHMSYLEEPFLPTHTSLSQLGTQGLDIHALQTHCLTEYQEWHSKRIARLLSTLETLDPTPDLVLFPEGSIPMTALPLVCAWAATHQTTVLAGTHTPSRTPSAKKTYQDVGLTQFDLRKIYKWRSRNVLPVVRQGKVKFVPKHLSSPFEESIVRESGPALPATKPVRVTYSTERLFIHVLPLICSEALQLSTVAEAYDIVGLIAFDDKPHQFEPFFSQQIRNKRAVLFCNDGHAGGSRIIASQDRRKPDWLATSLPDGLPPGDALLVVDLELPVKAVEVGTAIPSRAYTLVKLASITYEKTDAQQVSANLLEIEAIRDSSAREIELARLLKTGHSTSLQRRRLEFLRDQERKGLDSSEWWKVLGRDVQLSGLQSLGELEAHLSASCEEGILQKLSSSSPNAAEDVLAFIKDCRTKARGKKRQFRAPKESSLSVIDRDREVSNFHRFLDDSALVVLEVTGLREIGKTSVIQRALAQSGVSSPLHVRLTETSSLDFILRSILQNASAAPTPPYPNPVELCSAEVMASALSSTSVLLIERAHELLEGNSWRDDRLPDVIIHLIRAASDAGIKIVIETRRQLPVILPDPSVRTWLSIRGLSRDLNAFGVALFDAQLRRVGLAPSAIDEAHKSEIVNILGGHPVAIALAADATLNEGSGALVDSLRKRKGFFLNFVRQLVADLDLSDQERMLMQVLGLARIAIPREAVLGSVSFPAASSLRNLVALGAVEVTDSGRVQGASVLLDYFDSRELPPEIVGAFHVRAAQIFSSLAERDPNDLAVAVEAEFHAGLAGIDTSVSTNLVDGALGTAKRFFEEQKYDLASRILSALLARHRANDILSLASRVEAKRGRFDLALPLAREVLTRNPRDPWLLSELAKTALTQYQEQAATELIAIAKQTGVEDVSVLIVEGRLALRRKELSEAETIFRRATELTERNPWPYYYLGRALLLLGELDGAIDALHSGEEFYYDSGSRSRHGLNAIRTQLAMAYVYADRLDLARPMIESLLKDDPTPEVVRAYAAITIKEDGIEEAQEALNRLREARIRNRADRCQFHLLYGLFYLGIGNRASANREFRKAYDADRSNVFVMMKWARTLFDLAQERYRESDPSYETYLKDCGQLVRRILTFDSDNAEALSLLYGLRQRFEVEV